MKNYQNCQENQIWSLDRFVSVSPAMQQALKLAKMAAASDLPIMILGESGTGKTLLAQAIHIASNRRNGPFISFNASAMSDTLLESQLFGHEKGAFTGAVQSMPGKFELANSGTLFFDEIADMSLLAQAKILRAVEYGEYERLGSGVVRKADVRIISATNKPIHELVSRNLFRQDLYFRLKGITISLPPLRERQEDLPALIASEIQYCALKSQKVIRGIHPQALQTLLAYPWPGNLRELHNVIQTLVLLASSDIIMPEDITSDIIGLTSANLPKQNQSHRDLSLRKVVREHIQEVLSLCRGNKTHAAKMLGITRTTLNKWLRD